MNEFDVKMNEYGYHELIHKPNREQIKNYLQDYFDNESSSQYSKEYSADELAYFELNAMKKELIIRNHIKGSGNSLIDIGCGEGYLLKYFRKIGWEAFGVDVSDEGISFHNSDMLEYFFAGEIEERLEDIKNSVGYFDVVNMDFSLESCIDVERTIEITKTILKSKSSILILHVGNYFSPLHEYLFKEGILNVENWFNKYLNFSYFNKNGLANLMTDKGFVCTGWYGDCFIDLNLLNPITNYYKNPEVGKLCYQSMLKMERIFAETSLDNTIQLEKVMGDMGLGRHLTGIFRLKES